MNRIRWPVASMAVFGGITLLALGVFALMLMLELVTLNGEGAAIYWMCALATIVFGGAWLLLVVWSYVDAEQRGMNGALWAILVFVLGFPLGPVVYLVFRASNSDSDADSSSDTATDSSSPSA